MQPPISPFDGLLLVDKPKQLTSHDVVDRLRRHFDLRKAGHCGTLDPNATGLLLVVVGRATKLQDRLMGDDKTYEGILRLGITTDSHDSDGHIVAEQTVPPLTARDIEQVFTQFRGDIQQVPPMISAIKHHGQPLYKLARKGKIVDRKPRTVHIYDLRLLALHLPEAEFRVVCSKGTYVRTLCHDIGQTLGCGAHLAELRRIRSGKFDVQHAHTLDELLTLTRDQLPNVMIPLLKLVQELTS